MGLGNGASSRYRTSQSPPRDCLPSRISAPLLARERPSPVVAHGWTACFSPSGLQYQQAADELVRSTDVDAIVHAVEERDGKPTTFRINNAATAHYIRRIARQGEVVTPGRWGAARCQKARYRLKRSNSGMP